jgi:hypothetical protein
MKWLPLLLLATLPLSAGTWMLSVGEAPHSALAADPTFASAGRFFDGSTGAFGGSGTLIADQWVLTSAHVVQSVADFGVMSFAVGAGTYAIAQIVIHPAWSGSLTTPNDVALIRLAGAVPDITPALLNTGAAPNELGQTAVITGFGASGNGTTGEIAPAGANHAGRNVIDAYGDIYGLSPDFIAFDFDKEPDLDYADYTNQLGTDTPVDLEYLFAHGDSGGGLFIDFADGRGYVLAGVNTLLVDANNNLPLWADYGDLALALRVTPYLDFITTTLIPEPNTAALLVLGGLLGIRRRR